MEFWRTTQLHPDLPLFSGGILDSWPAFVVDGLAICRNEFEQIRRFLHTESST